MESTLNRAGGIRETGLGRLRHRVGWWPLWGLLLLAGCAPLPYREYPTAGPGQAATPSPADSAQVYFYPLRGQSVEQQSRDHYECYYWAVDQTGFDPGKSTLPTEQRLRVVPLPPPGHDTAAYAIAGAVLGALIGGPRHAAGGAVLGAAGGAMVGAASDTAWIEEARRREEATVAQDRARAVRSEAQTSGFRRAMSACLEGRGYSVR